MKDNELTNKQLEQKLFKKPPYDSTDVINLSLNYNNLQEYLLFLRKSDEISFKYIQEFANKFLIVDENTKQIIEIKIQQKEDGINIDDLIRNKFDHHRRLLSIESQCKDFDTEIKYLHDERKLTNTRMSNIENENSIHLKRLNDSDNRFNMFDFMYKVDQDKINLMIEKINNMINIDLTQRLNHYGTHIDMVFSFKNDISDVVERLVLSEIGFKNFEEMAKKNMSEITNEVRYILFLWFLFYCFMYEGL